MIARKLAAPGGGGSFAGSILYAGKGELVASQGITDPSTAIGEMEATAALSRRCKDPVHHEVIAYAKDEQPTPDQMGEDVERILKARDMEGHQYVAFVHRDTDDTHVHVVANRIGEDGKANRTSWDHLKAEREVARISAERGWSVVVGHHNRDIAQDAAHLAQRPPEPERRLNDGDFRRLNRSGDMPWQDAARPYIAAAVETATTWEDLHQRLGQHGIVAKHSVKLGKDGKQFHGLAFAEGHGPDAPGCAASRIDPQACKYAALEARFGAFAPAGGRDLADRDGRQVDDQAAAQRPQSVARSDNQAARSRDPADTPRRPAKAERLARARQKPAQPDLPQGQRQPQERGAVRAQAERDSAWQDRGSQIADANHLRKEFQAYKDAHRDVLRAAEQERFKEAWRQEQARRKAEAVQRQDAKARQKTIARQLFGRGAVRSMADAGIDAWHGMKQRQERTQARDRWEKVKDGLTADLKAQPRERPMDYRSFIASRTQQGDERAARQLDWIERKEAREADQLRRVGVGQDAHPVDAYQQLRAKAQGQAQGETPDQRRALDVLAQKIDRDPQLRTVAQQYSLAAEAHQRATAIERERARVAQERAAQKQRQQGRQFTNGLSRHP